MRAWSARAAVVTASKRLSAIARIFVRFFVMIFHIVDGAMLAA